MVGSQRDQGQVMSLESARSPPPQLIMLRSSPLRLLEGGGEGVKGIAWGRQAETVCLGPALLPGGNPRVGRGAFLLLGMGARE